MVKGGLWLIFVAATSASLRPDLERTIKKIAYNNNGLGTYSFEFETSDGTYRREEGGILNPGVSLIVRGEYSYVDPSGHQHSVKYIADENGFQPISDDEDTRFNDRRIF